MSRYIKTKTILVIVIILAVLTAITIRRVRSLRSLGAVTIGFGGFTNYQGNNVAVFDLTNCYHVPIYFVVAIERKTTNGWPTYGEGMFPHVAPKRIGQDPKIEPGETYTLLAIVPTEGDYSAWRVSVGYLPIRPRRKLDGIQQQASALAEDAGLSSLSGLLTPNGPAFIVLGPEMHK